MATDFQPLFSEGHRARCQGDAAHSRAIFLDAVRRAAEERDEPSLAEALCGLAQAERDIGNCPAALHHYANASVLYRRIGPPDRLAYTLRHQADLLRTADQPAEAVALYREAETIYRQGGEAPTLGLANTLRGLALAMEATADSSRTKDLWLEARSLFEQLDVRAGVEECDRNLASFPG